MSDLTDRLRGMFDMGVKSEDAFNHLTPEGFRLLREAHDEIASMKRELTRCYDLIHHHAHHLYLNEDKLKETEVALAAFDKPYEYLSDDKAWRLAVAVVDAVRPLVKRADVA